MRIPGALLLAVVWTSVSAQVQISNPRLLNVPEGTELLIDLSGPVELSSFRLQAPERIVVDLRGARGARVFGAGSLSNTLVHRVRGALHPGFLRVVLDIRASSRDYHAYTDAPGDGHGWRLVVRVASPAPVQPGAAAPALSTAEDRAPAPRTTTAVTLPEAAQEAILPLMVRGQPRGDLRALIAQDPARSRVFIDSLLQALADDLLAATTAQLRALRADDGTVGFPTLLDAGITLEVDPVRVVAIATLRPEVREKQTVNLYGRQSAHPLDADQAIRPAPLSAALDVFATQRWTQNGRNAFGAEFDGHVNVSGWVLQNRHSYVQGARRKWQRRETQLIHDWPQARIRFAGGDLAYPSVGMMGNRPLSGLSLASNFALQPYLATFPLSEHEFFLEEDARLDVYVNGALRDSRNLSAGPQSVFDLPLIDGVNNVVLELTDRFGRRQTLRFLESQDQRLLQRGLAEFAVTAGIPRLFSVDGIDYEHDTPSLSTFYRYGLTDTFTGGAHLEMTDTIAMTGLLGVWSGRWGTVALDLAASHDKAAEGGLSPGVQIDYLLRAPRFSITLGYIWQDHDFATLGQRAAANNLRDLGRIGIVLPRMWGWTSTLSLTGRRRWDGDNRTGQLLSMTRSLTRDWRFTMSLQNSRDAGKQDAGVMVQLYWAPSGKRLQANAGYDSFDHASNAAVDYLRVGELGLDLRSEFRHQEQMRTGRLDASYVHPLFEARGEAFRSRVRTGTDTDTQTLSAGTALAYADGKFAVSRPLRGRPFALVTGRQSLGDSRVGLIRGFGQAPFSYLGGAGHTAVLPNFSPYYVEQVNVDMRELPLGVQIEQREFRLLSTYRSGTLIQVGLEGEAYVLGRLVDASGAPLVYAVGAIRAAGRREAGALTFFTDEAGHFEAAGLKPGSYEISFKRSSEHASFQVPENTFGRFDVGTVQLVPSTRQRLK